MKKIIIVDRRSVKEINNFPLNKAKLKKLAITLDEFNKDVTPQEWKFIEAEKKYYYLVVALKKARNSMGLTQNKLAELSNIPRTTITRIESGSRNATLQTLMTIAGSMGKTIELRLA